MYDNYCLVYISINTYLHIDIHRYYYKCLHINVNIKVYLYLEILTAFAIFTNPNQTAAYPITLLRRKSDQNRSDDLEFY
jgi:hypothetical protein